ncbi:MAG TPA: protealysin inhibitor emfourin [Streptosporangiaceae bacterium]|nr:protealysin inhibitor emfourin [Streptosporangiaceae bacterium]
MKVIVVRSGGFAGLERRGEGDTTGDPVLRHLVDQVDLTALPAKPTPVPDQFGYEITIGDTTVEAGESMLTGPLRDLVRHVLR